MQTAGRIGDEDILAAGLRRLQGVVQDRRGIGPVRLHDQVGPAAAAPDFQLFDCGGTKGVRRRDDGALAGPAVAVGQLADGRRLADAVDAHHQDHMRFLDPFFPPTRSLEQLEQLVGQKLASLPGADRPFSPAVLPDLLHQAFAGLDSQVGPDQKEFQFLQLFR